MQVDYSYCQQTGKLKDSIISSGKILYGISEKENTMLQNQVSQLTGVITAQKKRIFWRGVEIWGYRIGIAGGVYFLIFR